MNIQKYILNLLLAFLCSHTLVQGMNAWKPEEDPLWDPVTQTAFDPTTGEVIDLKTWGHPDTAGTTIERLPTPSIRTQQEAPTIVLGPPPSPQSNLAQRAWSRGNLRRRGRGRGMAAQSAPTRRGTFDAGAKSAPRSPLPTPVVVLRKQPTPTSSPLAAPTVVSSVTASMSKVSISDSSSDEESDDGGAAAGEEDDDDEESDDSTTKPVVTIDAPRTHRDTAKVAEDAIDTTPIPFNFLHQKKLKELESWLRKNKQIMPPLHEGKTLCTAALQQKLFNHAAAIIEANPMFALQQNLHGRCSMDWVFSFIDPSKEHDSLGDFFLLWNTYQDDLLDTELESKETIRQKATALRLLVDRPTTNPLPTKKKGGVVAAARAAKREKAKTDQLERIFKLDVLDLKIKAALIKAAQIKEAKRRAKTEEVRLKFSSRDLYQAVHDDDMQYLIDHDASIARLFRWTFSVKKLSDDEDDEMATVFQREIIIHHRYFVVLFLALHLKKLTLVEYILGKIEDISVITNPTTNENLFHTIYSGDLFIHIQWDDVDLLRVTRLICAHPTFTSAMLIAHDDSDKTPLALLQDLNPVLCPWYTSENGLGIFAAHWEEYGSELADAVA
jgi:hypothetical protein